jgi:YfiH family protein
VLLRQTASNSVVFYASAKLQAIGVRHAFSTRRGGVSPPPFDSLNLGNPSDGELRDDQRRINQNYALLLAAVGFAGSSPLRVHQVHDCAVATVRPGQPFDSDFRADAIVSRDAQRAISVRIADCVPVLLSSDDGQTVAAVHAGWRGIVAGVIPAAVRRMVDSPASAQSLIAAIGPCIGREAFEVGEDVLSDFARIFGAAAPIERRGAGKGRVDLRVAARLQLLAAGLRSDRIDSTDRCTVTHGEEFFSHRRERGVTGRMAAVIAPRPSSPTSAPTP